MGHFIDKKVWKAIAPLISNMTAWNAFLALIDHEKEKITHKLKITVPTEELIRLNAEYTLLEKLTRTRETLINIEKDLV